MTLAVEIGPASEPLWDETIGENLARTVAAHGTNEAIVSCHQDIRWTYDEFAERVRSLAKGLIARGLGAGDRVGLWSPNYAEWVLVQYATAEIGVILVNLNPAYRTHELSYAIQHSGCRLVIAAPSFKTSDYRAMLAEVADECPSLESTLFFWDPDWEALASGDGDTTEADLDSRRATLSPDDPINIQYTSGTTGFPKGATLSHRNILNNGRFTSVLQHLTDQDRVCIPVPFYHCFGMVIGNLGCTTHGATIVIPGDAFDPLAVLRAVEAERCTSLYGVPTMFIAELGHERFEEFDLTSLRTGVMAGSPCPVEVMKACIDKMHMVDVTICYGMTETSPVSFQSGVDDPLEMRVSTVGRVMPHLEVKIVDAEGHTVPVGERGELCTKGYSVMLGYWGEDGRTLEAIQDGWMHTGDLATMDEEGFCNIVGRVKDMLIRGGENIYPREVEEFLFRHPKISQVQVFGVPDARYGEEVCAWVVLKTGESATEADIRNYCRDQIAHYKVPRHVRFVQELPMTVTGKAQKFMMRAKMIEELGLSGEVD